MHLRRRDPPLEELMVDVHHKRFRPTEVIIRIPPRDQRFDERTIHEALAVKRPRGPICKLSLIVADMDLQVGMARGKIAHRPAEGMRPAVQRGVNEVDGALRHGFQRAQKHAHDGGDADPG